MRLNQKQGLGALQQELERTSRTLESSTMCYRLRDSAITNNAIVKHLGLIGGSSCCFHEVSDHRHLVAIRTKSDEVVIFDEYEKIQVKMAEIADRIK